jgi:UDP-N-acetyl-D-glucosamine dehydrogenase
MRTLNYKTRFIDLASEINSHMPEWVVQRTAASLNDMSKSVNGSRVLVLGVAYKRDIDDVRESPALDVMRLLQEKGAIVEFHDPHISEFREHGQLFTGVPLSHEVLAATDAVLIITDHRKVDYQRVLDSAKLVIDARNVTAGMQPGKARVRGLVDHDDGRYERRRTPR